MPRKQPPKRWTAQELQVLIECLRSEEFMAAHAPSLERGRFPTISVREASAKGTEAHALCTGISNEILRRAGEYNGQMVRP